MARLKTVKILFKKKEYHIDSRKLIYILAKLENKSLDFKDEKELITLLEKYKLYNKDFLDKINNTIYL